MRRGTRERSRGIRPGLLVFGAALVVAAAAAAAAFVLRTSGSERPVLPTSAELVEGVAGSWQRVNPLYASLNEVDGDLAALVFSGLVKLGPDGSVQPDLAEALPEISADGRTYTFRIRPDARWHDGEPVTSFDVAFTIEQIRAPDFRGDPLLAEAWSTVKVETPDERTVILELEAPNAPFLARFATIGILPAHLLRGLSGQALYDAPFNAAPIGSGPYRVASLTDEEAVLEANAAYHLGRPGIDRIRIRFFNDYSAGLAALDAGEIDSLLVREPLTDAQAVAVQELSGVNVYQLPRAAYVVLYLNNAQAATFQDPRVRQAVSLALDRERIVEEVFHGAARPSSSPIPPGSWAYVPEYDRTEPDIARAQELLAAAGWRPHPTTGTLVREGEEFRITIRTDNDPFRVAVAEEVARQLDAIGIRATVASTTFAVLRRDFLQQRRYEAAVAGWDQGADPDPYAGGHSSQMGSAGLNIANTNDAVIDRLIETARTRHDPAVRKEMYRQLQEVWQSVMPSAILFYPAYTYLVRSDVQVVLPEILPTPAGRFAFVEEWRR